MTDFDDRDIKIFGTDGTSDHHHAGHNATDADPHVWTSVANARIMARNMADGLKKIDPENSAAYESRLSALNRRLDSIDSGCIFCSYRP